MHVTLSVSLQDEVPKYKKIIIKKGNKLNFPARGDLVKVYYTGTLEDGTVFDTNIHRKYLFSRLYIDRYIYI